MPSNYAHYRFGAAMLSAMPGDIRQTVKRFRRLYDVGLHGPDILFYYNPLWRTKLGSLGKRIHQQSGKEFFGRVCRGIRLGPTREAEAYLYGLLCHYAVDSVCHPFVWEQDKNGIAEHIELETEFDRFLLDMDGKIPPENQDLSLHLQLGPKECATVARFYPGATGKTIATSLRRMTLVNKTFAIRGEGKREWLKKGLGLAGWEYRGFVMTKAPNPQCCKLNKPLLELYNKAEERFPELLLQLNAHLTYNAPLGADFSQNFG